jgi:hypothetical protein
MVATEQGAMTPIHETNGANGVAHNGNGVADVGDSPIKAFYAGRCVCVCVGHFVCGRSPPREPLHSSTPHHTQPQSPRLPCLCGVPTSAWHGTAVFRAGQQLFAAGWERSCVDSLSGA